MLLYFIKIFLWAPHHWILVYKLEELSCGTFGVDSDSSSDNCILVSFFFRYRLKNYCGWEFSTNLTSKEFINRYCCLKLISNFLSTPLWKDLIFFRTCPKSILSNDVSITLSVNYSPLLVRIHQQTRSFKHLILRFPKRLEIAGAIPLLNPW